jgi:DNA end-binding protein Ku
MARAIWKGHLTMGELSCGIALYAAATTAERVSFHIVNRRSGNRVRRDYVDEATGKPVEREDQVKGYETAKDSYVILEPDEIAAAVPQGDKRLAIEHFISCGEVDTVYFDKPYFVTPADEGAEEAFAVMREGMRRKKVAALARAVLFRRVRTVMLRPQGSGFIANTLNFDYEVRSADKAFEAISPMKIKGEMLDLAKHIIATKQGSFDPAAFDDRYDAALAELIKAKMEGREIAKPKRKAEGKVIDLMAALRESAAAADKAKKPAPRRKAG